MIQTYVTAPYFQFYSYTNLGGGLLCHVPLADMRMSKDNMKNKYKCPNDDADSMKVCHARKGTRITVYDKDDMSENSGTHLDIIVKSDLGNSCATVSSFDNVGTTSDGSFLYERRKQGNGKLNGKISSFKISIP